MSVAIESSPVLTVADLATRWQAPGKSADARRKFVWRRVHEWSVAHDGIRYARFSLAAVRAAEKRHLEAKR